MATAVPTPSVCTALGPPAPMGAPSFPHDSSVASLLAKVEFLELRICARRSLGGLLADNFEKCAGNKFRKREGAFSCRRRRGRGSKVRSGSSREMRLVCSRPVLAFACRSPVDENQ